MGKDYVPSGNEKGHPAWDIGQILTRHSSADHPCDKVISLRRSARTHVDAMERLREAHAIPCSCGAGESESEHTTEKFQGRKV